MGRPLWVGTEDHEYVGFGGVAVSTDPNYYDGANGMRCSLGGVNGSQFWQNKEPYSFTDFWFSGKLRCSTYTNNQNGSALLQFLDDAYNPILQIRGEGGNWWRLEKISSGSPYVVTQLGNSFYYPLSINDGVFDKLDIQINYDVAGSVHIYANTVMLCAFLGDVTVDGLTAISGHRLGGSSQTTISWCATWIDEDDTRASFLFGFDPVAAGHANTYDIGSPSAANLREVRLDDATLNGASAAGLIDQYTVGPVPNNTLDVKGVVVSARAQRGPAGPTKIALGVRTTGGTDDWGSDYALDIAWTNPQRVFDTNPDTGLPWLKTEIGAAIGFNIGTKSVA